MMAAFDPGMLQEGWAGETGAYMEPARVAVVLEGVGAKVATLLHIGEVER